MDNIQKLFASIEILPPSPSLLPKLLPAMADVNSNFDEVVDMISLDPALTAKLLQICNSAFFGPVDPVMDVREAVNQVGYQAVYLLVSMINGGECFQVPEVPGVDGKQLWKHSVIAGHAAKFIAESAGLEAGMLFTAGLLHDIGKVVLARAYGKDYGLMLLRAAQAGTPAFQSEITAFQFSHAEVGACLMERWKLPAPLVAGVRFHHHPVFAPTEKLRRIAACVSLSDLIAHGQDRPLVINDLPFTSALDLLGLESWEVDGWQSRLGDCQSLIEMMSHAVTATPHVKTDQPCLTVLPEDVSFAGARRQWF